MFQELVSGIVILEYNKNVSEARKHSFLSTLHYQSEPKTQATVSYDTDPRDDAENPVLMVAVGDLDDIEDLGK